MYILSGFAFELLRSTVEHGWTDGHVGSRSTSRSIKIMQHIAPSKDIKRPSPSGAAWCSWIRIWIYLDPTPCSPSRTRAVSRKQHSIGCKSPVQRLEMAPGVFKKNSSWLRKKWDPLGFSSVWIIFLFGSFFCLDQS